MKRIIYVSNLESNTIQVIRMDNPLLLQSIQTIKVNGQIQPLAISKKNKLIYAGIRPSSQIITYQILDDGKLKEISQISVTSFPNHISLDHNENFLFCSSYHGECLNVLKLNCKGIPQKILHIFKSIKGCHYSHVNLNNDLLYATALKEDKIYMYHLTKNNNFIEHKYSPINILKNSGPRHLSFHPNKKYIYCINELNSTIDVWKHSSISERLNVIQNVRILPDEYIGKYWGADIHITPCGNYLYASDRSTSIITAFKINQTNGKIHNSEYYVTEKQPRSFHIDQSGKYLIVAGEKSNSITIYRIELNNNGLLYKLTSYKVGKNPIWILTYIP